MELVSGQDLFEVLVRERRLSQARAARIVVQVCAALEAAHRHGVVHRDLKPENVMLVRDPSQPGREMVKVLDFGIAKLLEREEPVEPRDGRAESLITLVGTVIGTPEYMSPEQARGTPPLDARSDVYAVGVLFYQLVTGRLPFRGETPIEVILQHIERAPAPPSSLVPELHPELERIILTALAKWPALRQKSAERLADEVFAVLPELGDAAASGQICAPPLPKLVEEEDEDDDDACPTRLMVADDGRHLFPLRAAAAYREPTRQEAKPPPLPKTPAPRAPSSEPLPWTVSPPSMLPRSEAPVRVLSRRPAAATTAYGVVVDWVARWWVLVMAILVLSAAIWLAEVDARQPSPPP
jgi:serine/threonine protein kinase